MIICVCHNISENKIKSAIKEGLNNMHLLRENLAIGTCCGKCKSSTKKILRECAPHENHKKPLHQTIYFHKLAT